jgi:CBS domain containing-hemolysin-like protein
MSSTVVQVLIAVFGIFVAFSASAWANAISRLTVARARRLAEGRRKVGRKLVAIAENPRPYITSVLLVMLVGRVAATVIVAALLIRHGVPGAEAIAIAVMSFLLFQVVEVAPRSWVLERPDQVMLLSARPVWLLGRILGPVAGLVVKLNKLFLLVLPGRGLPKSPLTSEEEIKGIIDVAESEEVIETGEREMIHSIFEFGDTVVREVMVPRHDMVVVEAGQSLEETLDLAIKQGYSRIPVINGTIDDVIGVIYAKDVMRRLRANSSRRPSRAAQAMREAFFVPESKKVAELLREMQEGRNHMAIVIDEYGGTAGLVTIEDLLEEIVGEISDEHDREELRVETLDDETLRVNPRLAVDELGDLVHHELPEGEWDSVGGLVVGTLGRVPAEGDKVALPGLELEVEKMRGRRIARVLVRRRDGEGPEAAS